MAAEYKPWYKRYPEMFEVECDQMRNRQFALDNRALAQLCVRFIGRSSIDPTLVLTVTYPDSFPSSPPRVATSPNWGVLKRHQNPNTREICTFGQNQRRWSATLYGTAAIDEAETVIKDMSGQPTAGETERDELIDDVPEPISVSYLYQSQTFILVPPKIFKMSLSMGVGDMAQMHLRFKPWPGLQVSRTQAGRGVVTELRIGKTTASAEQFYQNSVNGGIEVNGLVHRLAAAPPVVTSAHEFNDWLRTLAIERRDWMGFIFPEQAGTASNEQLTWIVFRSRNEKVAEPLRTFVTDESGSNPRLPNLESLAQKTAVLIGCGSIGSKVGTALAATGVEGFGLVDFDFMEPSNAVRHELGVESFGIHKVHALTRRLIELNPRAWDKVEVGDILLGQTNQPDKEALLQRILSSASIVIDSTGNHAVSRFINDICAEFKVPQIYASVTNGAWAGEVVRVIPRKTACWLCWQDQYYDLKPPGEPTPEPGLFAPGCDHPTFTGTTYDIGIVASLAASMAVDTLLIDDANRKHFNGDYIRWQLKDAEGNLVPKIEVLPVAKREKCRLCERQ
jgi:molybdopterin/thiamine biosynthesis adenylyltransferase